MVPKAIYQPSNTLFTEANIMQEEKIYIDLLFICVHQQIIKEDVEM